MSYKEALSLALIKVGEDKVVSSWKDSLASGRFSTNISEYLKSKKKIVLLTEEKRL
jgi:hypothetical protein